MSSDYQKLLKVLNQFNDWLSNLNEEEFQKKPNSETWSYAQVYAHIMMANRLSLKGMQRSSQNNGTETMETLPFKAKLILFFARFPKGRKVPKSVEERTPEIKTLIEAKEIVARVIEEVKEIYKTNQNWSGTMKMKHPVLGYMNNKEWLRFIYIHTIHHYKQLIRIKKLLHSNN